ncbi:hypothetical protein BDU57DRAFT_524173 [Ampelomyces quisqualis]|uniref:Uncharacterized protein n=1 Tax=Ampelomyces quisqualis TaxID=50730 RepID=A0A6A5Q891_AMPQU|nr:hypothetical protein BDU57DRAFT_524173 [Ampelomyces quisqualis]
MYITSELFGGSSTRNYRDPATSTYWTTMTDSPHPAGLGKRKRHDAEEASSTNHTPQQRLSSPSRRYQGHNTPSSDSNRNLPYPVHSTSPLFSASDRRPVKQMKRTSPKSTLFKSPSHLMDMEPDLPPPSSKEDAHAHPHSITDLRPCHACKSAPKRRKDLENYLDCRRCDGRTCYICARQCFGRCGKAVCKKCIVEVGQEGDPWCLDCYARDINS